MKFLKILSANVLAIAVVVVLIFTVISFILNSYTRHGESLTVPDIRGLKLADAQKLLEAKKLRFTITDSLYFEDKPRLSVLEQNPAPQSKVKEGNKSVLSGVAKGTPSMIKALRMQEKAAQVGFDWETPAQVWAKVDEELAELKEEFAKDPAAEKTEKELGDFFFALINLARKYDINPDDALEKTNQKFIQRFQYIEQKARETSRKLTDMTLEEMDAYWNEAKGNTGS